MLLIYFYCIQIFPPTAINQIDSVFVVFHRNDVVLFEWRQSFHFLLVSNVMLTSLRQGSESLLNV